MTLLGFMLLLVVCSFLATFAFSILMVALVTVLAIPTRIRALAYPVLTVTLVAQAYFWGLWAAYCSMMAMEWSASATFPPIYYLVALGGVTSPIGWMSHKEMATARSGGEAVGIQRGTVLYGSIALAAYIVFSIWPTARQTIYPWIAG